MKPFNIKEALEGKPFMTGNGHLQKLLAYVPDAWENTRVVCINADIPGSEVRTYCENGQRFLDGKDEKYDLFMAEGNIHKIGNAYEYADALTYRVLILVKIAGSYVTLIDVNSGRQFLSDIFVKVDGETIDQNQFEYICGDFKDKIRLIPSAEEYPIGNPQ